MEQKLELKVYRIKLGSLGEYVYCATSIQHLYNIILNEDNSRAHEILYDCRVKGLCTFEEFKKYMTEWITESPLHLGFLGGYSE